MGWKDPVVAAPEPLPIEVLMRKESLWESAYNEPERWIADLAEGYYLVTGQYEIDKNKTLYRFELDEEMRSSLAVNAPHFISVVIDSSIPPAKIGMNFNKKS